MHDAIKQLCVCNTAAIPYFFVRRRPTASFVFWATGPCEKKLGLAGGRWWAGMAAFVCPGGAVHMRSTGWLRSFTIMAHVTTCNHSLLSVFTAGHLPPGHLPGPKGTCLTPCPRPCQLVLEETSVKTDMRILTSLYDTRFA